MTMNASNDSEKAGPKIERIIDLKGFLAKKSHFLFGPRQLSIFWFDR